MACRRRDPLFVVIGGGKRAERESGRESGGRDGQGEEERVGERKRKGEEERESERLHRFCIFAFCVLAQPFCVLPHCLLRSSPWAAKVDAKANARPRLPGGIQQFQVKAPGSCGVPGT